MTNRLTASLLLAVSLLLPACGGADATPAKDSPTAIAQASVAQTPVAQPTAAAESQGSVTPAAVDSARFVFGATPGKPVVYWVHTDW